MLDGRPTNGRPNCSAGETDQIGPQTQMRTPVVEKALDAESGT